MAPSRSRGPIAFLVFIAVVVAGWQIALWFEGSDADSPARSADPAQATEPQAPIEAIEDGVPAPQTAADYALRAGEIMTIRAAELPPDRPVILGLVLPVPSTEGAALIARIVDESGRQLDAKAIVTDEAGRSANLEIEPGWLSPATYLIHLKTTERSHFPLRRYPLEVR